MITKTQDYGIFNTSGFNRDLKEKNVLKLMQSLKAKNLLKNRPILVDKNMTVVDGQHRLEAAKRLNIPVWYEIQTDLEPEDIVRLNDNQKLWDNYDYLKFHIEKRNPEYMKLKKFMDEHNVNIGTAFAVLGISLRTQSRAMKKAGEEGESNPFKAGKFLFPASADQVEAVEILNKSKQIIDYALPKLQGNNKFLNGPAFRRALYIFLSIKAVDFDAFMSKLSQRLDLIRPCSRLSDFIYILKQIYNFKNRNPITLDEFDTPRT